MQMQMHNTQHTERALPPPVTTGSNARESDFIDLVSACCSSMRWNKGVCVHAVTRMIPTPIVARRHHQLPK
eukprot:m.504 g.504  ORF g.504 m.504 type:complete len:71 (-) comp275_c0_seq1:273-485(-)